MVTFLVIMASALFALLCRLGTRFPAYRSARLIGLWVVLASTVELLGAALKLLGWNNTVLYIIFCAVEFVLLVVIARALAGTPSKWTGPVLATFFVVWVVEFRSVWHDDRFVTYSFMIGALWLIGLYLQRLWHLVNTWSGNLRSTPDFWLCLAVLLYFGAAAPLMGSLNYFMDADPELAKKLFLGVRILCVLKFILMGITCLRMHTPNTFLAHERPV